jgi:hypothetical protein
VETYNSIAEQFGRTKLLSPEDLARNKVDLEESLKRNEYESAPQLISAYTRKLVKAFVDKVETNGGKGTIKILPVLTKVQARAELILEHFLARKKKSLISRDARKLCEGAEGVQISRRDIIRALRKIPFLDRRISVGKIPNDLRGTIRILINFEKNLDRCQEIRKRIYPSYSLMNRITQVKEDEGTS